MSGSDISSIGLLRRWTKETNQEKKSSGYDDWRLPTIEEALSLVGREKGKHGSYINPCFDLRQGYVYTADRRKPGGYWFVGFRPARVCSGPPGHLPEVSAGYAVQNEVHYLKRTSARIR